MSRLCTCPDWQEISQHHPSVFKLDTEYGWLISWVDFTLHEGRVVKSNYGVKIRFCPFCGKKLYEATDV